MTTLSVRRFVVAKARGLRAKIETTNCMWCCERGICSAHYQTVLKAEASLARTADKRDARRRR